MDARPGRYGVGTCRVRSARIAANKCSTIKYSNKARHYFAWHPWNGLSADLQLVRWGVQGPYRERFSSETIVLYNEGESNDEVISPWPPYEIGLYRALWSKNNVTKYVPRLPSEFNAPCSRIWLMRHFGYFSYIATCSATSD